MKPGDASVPSVHKWLTIIGTAVVSLLPSTTAAFAAERSPVPGGVLHIIDPTGKTVDTCPLQRTEVEAHITGFVSRVQVRQHFVNRRAQKVEAVYVFPLPQNAAVDRMLMTVGSRRIVGQIKPRDEARQIYEAARAAGHVTGLLDQERPNIFTQSVANIEPGEQVSIEIEYVETLPYDDGMFEFVFPTVVGPRYMPGLPAGSQGTGWAPDTTAVPDASRISPPVAIPGTRAGHDISLTISIDAGMDIHDLASPSHDIDTRMLSAREARVSLRNQTEIPNRDFILRYRTAADGIGDAFLVHQDERGRFFTLILQPPRRVTPRDAVPKELIFVIDRSGSMSGFPIEKAKETMRLAIGRMNPRDTFNLLSFSGGIGRCFDKSVPNTPENRAAALKYLEDLYGSGGTEMMPAILAALGGPDDPERLRVVAFMTDGYIGNDLGIIDAVRQHAGTARVFSFGIGTAVNRFLLDGMAQAGRGEVEYVSLTSNADEAAQRFQERIQSPVLTDISIDWGTLPVSDVYPKQVPDLFSAKPIMVHGRLTGTTTGTITLRGRTAEGPFETHVEVMPPAHADDHEGLASLWARAAVHDLMMRDYGALQRGAFPDEIRQEVTNLGIEFHLVTQFTSFVAVEEMTVTAGGTPTTVAVPVEIPEGVSYENIFGARGEQALARSVGANSLAGGGGTRSFLNGFAAAPSAPLGIVAAAPSREGRPGMNAGRPADLKLAQALRGLAEKVVKEDKDGNCTIGTLRVTRYRVDVVVYLRDVSAATLDALTKLGFRPTSKSKGENVVIGSVDVRKLDELAKLEAVTLVTPVPA